MYKATFERVIRHFSGEKYLPELRAAKEVYFVRTGKVFDDDPVYESRMAAFLEWFLLDRPLFDLGIPPIRYFRETVTDASEAEHELLIGLERSNHSLFRFLRRGDRQMVVEDLFDGQKLKVTERRSYPGLRRDDLLDARIFSVGKDIFFTEAMWLEPRPAYDVMVTEARRRAGGTRDSFREFLFELAYAKLKSERYQHLAPADIYRATLSGQELPED